MTDQVAMMPAAIIGMACRFPGAPDLRTYWDLLLGGREGVADYVGGRTAELDAFYGAAGSDLGAPSGRGGFVEGIEHFDADFFGISPREAEFIDPQQRILLELAWEALEDAGLAVERLAGPRTGVFIGVWTGDYERQIDSRAAVADIRSTVCNALFGASGRLAAAFDFRGPELSINSGCASSLVAINQAIAALRSGQCDVALVGGANAVIRPEITQAFGRAGVLSPDGRCKFGDASANGFVRSDGAGMLVLKRLGQACADGDRIRACIRGSAVNNNGSSSGFLTRPSEVGQAEVIVSALADANVSPADIAYVEAHGTGTAVGDPIEISALAAVLGRHPDRTEPCLVGSAKSNIGHTEAAAGMAGVIKTVLALEHRHLPPTLHVNTPNPAVDWSRAGVALNTVGRPWPGSEPRLAGVSAFGVTGSNAHVILQEAPAAKPLDPTSPALAPRSAWALPLSAHSPEALATLALAYADALDARSDLADICFTAATRRSSLPYRLVAVSDDAAALTTRLRTWAKEGTAAFVVTGHDQAESATRPVMVFPGQGSQWDGMGRELMAREPVFHAAIMRCDAAVQAEVGWSVRQRLLDGAGLERAGIEVIQPILFSIQVALAELWSRWGVKPAVLVGHSMGEVAAAHVAGALSLEHAARIICRRSALMTRFSGQGAMMLAELSLDEAAEAIAGHEGEVSIAAANGPRSTVFAGEPAAVHAVASKLQSAGVFTRSVAVQVAAHSPQMGLIRYELQQSLGDVRPKAGSVPIYSTTLGRLTDGAEFDAAYWAKNLRQPVLFHPALKALMANGQQTFIEVSPHPILVPSIEETAREAGVEALTLASLRRNEPEQANMLAAFGTLFVRRFPVDWSGIYPTGRIADLPGHPWRRQRYWPDNDNAPQVSLTAGGHPLLPPPFKTAEHSWVWTSRLSTETLPWLKDHSVRGTTLLPASAYVEIAIVAARQIIGQAKVQVHNLRLIEAIVLSHEQTLQVMATAERPGRWSIKIHVRNGSPDNWTVAATGVVTTDPDIELEPLPVDQVGGFQAGAPADAVTGEAHANDLFRLGYDFGPNFLNLRWIDLAGDALRAEALLSDQLRTTAYGLHPALLDAGFQVVAAGLLRRRSQREVLIPQSIGRARLFPAAASAAVAYIQADIEPQGLSGNLRLFNADGAPVAEVLGLRFQAFASTGDTSETGLLHGLDWVPAEAVSPQASPRTWLVLPDVGGEGVAFAAAMRRLGVTADVIEPTRADRFGVRDGTLQRRLAPRMVSPGELGVVSFASLDLPADASTEMIAANGAELTELATFLADIAGTSLCFVTRGACAVDPGQPVSVPQASVWGLGAVIANEVPELSCRLIDLAPDGGPQTDSLAAEMLSGSSEPRIALRADRRLVARLRVRHGDTPSGFSRSLQPHERAEIVVGTPGMLDTLSISRARRSAPATGEVEIEVHAAGMNFLDVIRAMGLFDPLAGRIPKLGAECAGRVVRVGDGVTGVKVGDRVVALSPAFQDVATFTSHLIVPAALTASVPASLSFAQAAALPCVYLTSYFALVEAARVRPGETVLIHSGTGGVGLSAIHVARWLGAKVIASAGSEEKRALLRSLGIEGVFDSRAPGFVKTVAELTNGRGVDVVLNALAGEAIPEGLAALAPFGRFIEIGKRDMWDNSRIGLGALLDNRSLIGVDLAAITEQQPERAGALLRTVMDLVGDGTLPALPVTEFPAERAAEAFQLMAAAKHIGKMVITTDAMVVITEAVAPPVRPDRTYLITGGLGALGLIAAEALVALGSRHLALCGRRAPSAHASKIIGDLRLKGVTVAVHAVDLGDGTQLRRLLDDIADTPWQLGGVVHSAGILDDALIGQLSADRFLSVMRGKLEGARLLDRLTRELPLDFFVMFSSAAALVGSMGQANYAAANAMLDALAADRTARGLPALSIAWGPWSEIGLAAADTNRGERVAAQGLESLSPDEGQRLFKRLLSAEASYVAAMKFDASRWMEVAASSTAALFADLPKRDPDAAAASAAAASGVFPADAESMQQLVTGQLATVLRTSPDRVAPGKPFRALGLDSLMGLELRNRLERALGLKLSATTVWNYPTATQLCAYLVSTIEASRPPQHPAQILTDRKTAASRALEDELLEAEALLEQHVGD